MVAAWYRDAFQAHVRQLLRERDTWTSLKELHGEALRRWGTQWKAATQGISAEYRSEFSGPPFASINWTTYELIRQEVLGNISIARAGKAYRITVTEKEGDHLTTTEVEQVQQEQRQWEARRK